MHPLWNRTRPCAAVILWLVPVILSASYARSQDLPVELVAPTEPLSAAEQQKLFRLPPGFEIQLVTSEPDIHKPMNLNFDGRGRLYVTSSLEYPFPATDGAPKRDAVKVITLRPDTGQAIQVKTMIEGLNIPIGVTPVQGGLLYYTIPTIHRAEDANGDARIETDRVVYQQFGFRDTHGMGSSFTRWIDGWVYACHGYANDSQLQGSDGKAVTMNSGNTYRLRADGSHVEQFTHGQVNPFGLCFDPLGNLFSADCHTKPIYQLLRGAWYPSFGKPHDGLGFGPEMIEHFHGSTGIAGVVYYAADQFPAEYRGTVFIGSPVTGRVNHDRLELHGSTTIARELPDFVRCDDPWFRPVDVKLGPDGALYIADFYNCIIGHYEVPLMHPRRDRERGRIWRIIYRGGEQQFAPEFPEVSQQDSPGLARLLGHPNLTVRLLATEELVGRKDQQAVQPLLGDTASDPQAVLRRAHAMWIVERLSPGGLDAAQIERLGGDSDRLVRVHLIKLLAERADWSQSGLDVFTLVRGRLSDEDAFVRRAAADALGRHPATENLRPLLDLWARTSAEDTHLIHVARMALRDQLLQPGMYARLDAALTGDPQTAARLAEVSLGAATAEAAEFLLGNLQRQPDLETGILEAYLHHAVRYVSPERVPDVFRLARSFETGAPAQRQRSVLVATSRACQERGEKLPEDLAAWASRLARGLLAAGQVSDVQQGIELAQALGLTGLYPELAALAASDARFPELRVAAMDACLAQDAAAAIGLLSGILENSAEPMPLRQKAASVLGGLPQSAAHDRLLRSLPSAPTPLAVEIARGLSIRRSGAERLLREIVEGRASVRLLEDGTIRARLESARLPNGSEQLKQLMANLPPADERMQQLVADRKQGFVAAQSDADRGRAVFRKSCAVCHRIAGEGTKIGPDLEGVGIRGLDRLLEDTLDPNRNVDQAFRATVVTTAAGQVVTGLALREEGRILVLADPQGKEVRLPLAEINERGVAQQSPMPANVAEVVTEADYYDLLRFLLSQRQSSEAPAAK